MGMMKKSSYNSDLLGPLTLFEGTDKYYLVMGDPKTFNPDNSYYETKLMKDYSNYLDNSYCQGIADKCFEDDKVLIIGAGLGDLTMRLKERGIQSLAIEIDPIIHFLFTDLTHQTCLMMDGTKIFDLDFINEYNHLVIDAFNPTEKRVVHQFLEESFIKEAVKHFNRITYNALNMTEKGLKALEDKVRKYAKLRCTIMTEHQYKQKVITFVVD